MKISGNYVDIHNRKIFPAEVVFEDKIDTVTRTDYSPDVYILPGLIDSHIHIESSMITPGAFGCEAVRHGTVGVVSDPHEIANVLGVDGISFMLRDASASPVHFWFGAPSCVPATDFETSGGRINSEEIETILGKEEIKYLSEMMNFPGVIFSDLEVLKKIRAAKAHGKPVDGHAPGLRGDKLRKYIDAGITTDHECSTLEEALEKISLGMKIQIREGSAARNLDALKDLILMHPDKVMLCSDDLHPEMLLRGHINRIVAKLISEGYDKFNVLRSATIVPSEHYGLNAGLLRPGDRADFIIVDDLNRMNVNETWIGGRQVCGEGKVRFGYEPGPGVNRFNCSVICADDISVIAKGARMRVMEAEDGELITREKILDVLKNSVVSPDPENDILKIVVKDRYTDSTAAAGFISGFGLKKGAFASSVAHDSHNIVAVGANDSDIVSAVNSVIEMKGGLAVASDGIVSALQLDIAGIMTTRSCGEVALKYERLNSEVRSLGCHLKAPFMTLSFMSLLVIPDLKIGDRGLFDVNSFSPVSLFIDT